MSTKHTPTPWKLDPYLVGQIVSMDEVKLIARAGRVQPIYDEEQLERNANAAFIVRACNSYEQLVAALEETLAEAIGWLDESRGCHPTNLMDHGWYDRAKAALAAAAGVA